MPENDLPEIRMRAGIMAGIANNKHYSAEARLSAADESTDLFILALEMMDEEISEYRAVYYNLKDERDVLRDERDVLRTENHKLRELLEDAHVALQHNPCESGSCAHIDCAQWYQTDAAIGREIGAPGYGTAENHDAE